MRVVGRVAAGRAKLHRAPIGAQATDTMADGNLDLVIAGAGFAGMYMLQPARAMCLSAGIFDAVADATLYPSSNSWYSRASIPGKPGLFMPYLGLPAYMQKCAEAAAGYHSFAPS
jgi:hypothetical protein